MSAFRDISFPKSIELDFGGSVTKNALCLCDMDNDGLNELILGNDRGEIAIFKGESSKPTYSAKVNGIISTITCGDILNLGTNVLVVITACGQCTFFDISYEGAYAEYPSSKKVLNILHTQKLPANVKEAHAGDVNGDGLIELVISLTDRIVRTYRWITDFEDLKDNATGKLVGAEKWEFAEQIEAITLHYDVNKKGQKQILVSQPGGSFITLNGDESKIDISTDPLDKSVCDFLTKTSFKLESLISEEIKISDIQGNINNNVDEDGPSISVASLDGTLMLIRNKNIIWERFVENELFTVKCLDIKQDGNEEIVACAWDGSTYIVTHRNECVKFKFHSRVMAFTAGLFGISKKQSPCLVYATKNNKIYIYYDIYIKYMNPKILTDILLDNDEYCKYVESLNIDLQDEESLRKLNENLLYGRNK